MCIFPRSFKMNQRKVFFDNIKNDLKDRGRDYVKAQNRRHWRAS